MKEPTQHSPTPLLAELPAKLNGSSAWLGSQLQQTPDKWLHPLSAPEIQDLENAANHFLTLDKDIGQITKNDFPLKKFNTYLGLLSNTILQGIGVGIIRGLPVNTYSQKFAATIFCGIGAHIGSARSQNAQGHILGHVRDVGADINDPNSRIYQTSERQTFHTDSADVVGLLCLQEAKEGGLSLLVSAESIYNRMRSECPELLEKLFEPIATDRRGEIPEGEKPFMEIPVFSWHEGFLTVFYQRQYIDSAQRLHDAPPLSSDTIKALDRFDEIANDPAMHLSMQLQPGDMQFVYNHNQLHDRTGFLDWPDPAKRRHLLRLWLSIAGDRPLPPVFKQRYGSIEVGNRGGIVVKGTRLHAPI